jgi:hypothetical protein
MEIMGAIGPEAGGGRAAERKLISQIFCGDTLSQNRRFPVPKWAKYCHKTRCFEGREVFETAARQLKPNKYGPKNARFKKNVVRTTFKRSLYRETALEHFWSTWYRQRRNAK